MPISADKDRAEHQLSQHELLYCDAITKTILYILYCGMTKTWLGNVSARPET